MTARQLTLDLPHRPALAREDFLVAPSNAAAVALVDQWPRWPSYGAIIVGPSGSGKTHLAHVWQQRSNAVRRTAAELDLDILQHDLHDGALVLEEADAPDLPERILFHALNTAIQHKAHVLLTAKTPPNAWPLTLPDLRSRLSAIPVAAIEPPDDALLRGVLVKHFADRQIAVSENLISYLLLRMPRSLAVARDLVAEIDMMALEQGAEVTRPFVGRILEAYLARHGE